MISAFASLETVEQLFLFFPLVAAPLVVRLLALLLFPRGTTSRLFRAASLFLPAAAVTAALSLFFPRGATAGMLAAPWVVFALALLLGVVSRIGRMKGLGISRPCLVAGQVFLLVGSVWLLLSRLGVSPPRFTRPVVFLAALHFHFTGLAGCTLVAATGAWVRGLLPGLRRSYHLVTSGAIVGIPLIAAGNALAQRVVKLAGVSIVSLTVIALSVVFLLLALRIEDSVARVLLTVAGSTALVGMSIAVVYGLGEFTGRLWITIPQMARWHAPVNALGFTLFGLLAHLRLKGAGPAAVAAPAGAAGAPRG